LIASAGAWAKLFNVSEGVGELLAFAAGDFVAGVEGGGEAGADDDGMNCFHPKNPAPASTTTAAILSNPDAEPFVRAGTMGGADSEDGKGSTFAPADASGGGANGGGGAFAAPAGAITGKGGGALTVLGAGAAGGGAKTGAAAGEAGAAETTGEESAGEGAEGRASGDSLGLSLNFPPSPDGTAATAGAEAETGTVGAAAVGGTGSEMKSGGGLTGADGVANSAGAGAVTRGFAMPSGGLTLGTVGVVGDGTLAVADAADGVAG
jgi:hypothetical protein